jgi:dipeptidyl aminopeptidase/acylaminoacyl peptidase
MLGQDRLIGYHHVQLFSVLQRRSSIVRGPKNMAADDVRWTSDGRSLLVLAADRFIDSLWVVDPRSSKAHEVNTNSLNIARIEQDARGGIYFTASSSTFTGRVFKKVTPESLAVQEVYEPNPQFSTLLFGLQKRITWKNSAGEEVDGIVVFPPGYQHGHSYPLLIDLYPTPARDDLRLVPGALGQVEAANGYVVFLPALRAPNAAASFSRDEIYNEKARGAKGIAVTVDDFTSGVRYLEREGIVDPRRIGLFGHSNGGYLVNVLITETRLARCAVVWSGASDLTYEQYFIPAWIHEIANGSLYDSFEDLVRMSPLFRMDRVEIPLLMVVGDHDWNTWLPEMLMQFNALKQLGKDVTLVRYADEGHNISHPDDVRDFEGRVQQFFDLYIGRNAAPLD